MKDGNPLKSYHDGNVDLGGPVFKRRLWFYGSYRNQDIRQGVLGYVASPGADNIVGTADDVPGEYRRHAHEPHRQADRADRPEAPVHGFVQAQTKDYPERNADAFRYKESTWHQIFKPLAGKGEWSWMISDRTFLNAFVGRWQYETDALNWTEDPAAYDTVTLRYSGQVQHVALRRRPGPVAVQRQRVALRAERVGRQPRPQGRRRVHRRGPVPYDAPARSNGRDYQLRFQNGVPFQVVVYNYPYNSSTR